jgi:hypothetical protein
MLPSNNTGINFQFCRLQNYRKKHAEKVDLKKILSEKTFGKCFPLLV